MKCNHQNHEVVFWEWTGFPGKEPFIAVQYKCKDCNEYFVRFIRDCMECNKFIAKYADKEVTCN